MCVKLEVLLLDNNKLSAWPLPSGGGVATDPLPLRELSLANNSTLRAAPPGAFVRTPLLQKLDLSHVTIPFAPAGFLDPLTRLRELRWAKGGLTQIPDAVYRMEDLRVLRVPDNKIFSLPADVARLTKLDELDLTNNDLSTLPAELGLLPLRSLGVEGNMLRMIRRPVIERGTAALLEHLRDKLPAPGSDVGAGAVAGAGTGGGDAAAVGGSGQWGPLGQDRPTYRFG